jgi:molecular chaperone GrpE (heat shock protein)
MVHDDGDPPWVCGECQARKENRIALVNRALVAGTVRTNEEHQTDFEGEEPTNANAQHFNREWFEARHVENSEHVQALRAQVEELTRLCNVWTLKNQQLRKQIESMAKRAQQERQHVVLVDIQDID